MTSRSCSALAPASFCLRRMPTSCASMQNALNSAGEAHMRSTTAFAPSQPAKLI